MEIASKWWALDKCQLFFFLHFFLIQETTQNFMMFWDYSMSNQPHQPHLCVVIKFYQ